MTVTFFGHRDTPQNVYPILYQEIEKLIQEQNATIFYVGNQGNFDKMAIHILKTLKTNYTHIQYTVVLAYIPQKKLLHDETDYENTMLPEEIENTPPRFAIAKRNRWMIDHADTIVCHVLHQTGGAAQCMQLAQRKKRNIVNIAMSIHQEPK